MGNKSNRELELIIQRLNSQIESKNEQIAELNSFIQQATDNTQELIRNFRSFCVKVLESELAYKECASRYGAEEISQIAELFSMTIMALEDNPAQDFLGDIFGSLNLHNEWHGQFFTPYHIGSMMARMQLPDKPVEELWTKPITICDPCCGAGCLLIACANEAKNLGINYQEKMVFYAQDIDRIAALMCYIQLSLLGCKAFIKIGNSLTDPLTENESLDENIWLTPMLAGETIFKLFGLQAGRKGKHDVVEEGIQPDENSDESRQPLEGKVSA